MAAAAPGTMIHVHPDMLQAGVELVPVPAAFVLRDASGWRLEASNRAYRRAGLGTVSERAPMLPSLAAALDQFMASELLNHEFAWSTGEQIDSRHYQVGFGRLQLGRQRCLVTLLDQTSRLDTERSLRREMTTDSLTGLPNREGFSDLIEAVAEERARHAVLVIDLLRFDHVNSCMGSLVGDELLITVARRIKGALRARDSLARLGGDEFGVLMAVEEGRVEAAALADGIRRALQAPFRLSDFEIGVECSIGIAIGADDDGPAEELIRHAQFAVKRAQASGHAETYQPQAFSVARARFAMETALRRAIEDRRLRLTYQPICELATGRIISFESLARWTDEDGRDCSPDEFIPVAEESGLIVPLGRWAIDEAARTLAGWDRQAGGDCGIKLAVNLSAIQLQRDTVPAVIEAALAATGLTGERLTLELTESAIVSDPERIARTMHELKALGTTLAMDDFGTGYSNLAYLQQLPIDILKIDRSFVTGMLTDRNNLAIVRAVLSLAQALGKQTTAEGVETGALAQTLAALGCTFGQGYFYAKPLEASSAWRMIASATTESAIDATREFPGNPSATH
ncbi:MAG: diguanylate cyclase [Sphingomonas bacterium]|uniref:putative bifunctional diguanylate cyclase/phosphodiesterase n=1 Tax=Sphingomonas bacterium TaxID=1895847 RepID=UPI002635707C|nr:bifunctional diguanylate cyclase/phosphodiesterase [Sphingomonas bacterium]MDB5696044.1 diguanylate cyclase [Sphingomonas bacterium]